MDRDARLHKIKEIHQRHLRARELLHEEPEPLTGPEEASYPVDWGPLHEEPHASHAASDHHDEDLASELAAHGYGKRGGFPLREEGDRH
jgi:hypothetical protein